MITTIARPTPGAVCRRRPIDRHRYMEYVLEIRLRGICISKLMAIDGDDDFTNVSE